MLDLKLYISSLEKEKVKSKGKEDDEVDGMCSIDITLFY